MALTRDRRRRLLEKLKPNCDELAQKLGGLLIARKAVEDETAMLDKAWREQVEPRAHLDDLRFGSIQREFVLYACSSQSSDVFALYSVP